jgi:hypothetical protein
VRLVLGRRDVWRRVFELVLGLEGGRLGLRRGRQGRQVFFIDQALAKPPRHFGPIALATDGKIRPFPITIAVSIPAAVAILGSGRGWKSGG